MTRWCLKLVENLQLPCGYASPACVMLVVLGLTMLAGQPRARAASPTPWSAATQSRVRLISAGGLVDGHYRVGIEIELQGRAHTYWRSPGDSGVPPDFTFGGSQNLGAADVQFPVPRRLMESGSEIFGYLDRVVLLVRVTPADVKKQVPLELQLNYATCEQICVPASAKLAIVLKPDDAVTPEQPLINEWQARIPKPLLPSSVAAPDAPVVVITPAPATTTDGHTNPTWHVDMTPDLPDATLFPESPAGWFVVARKAAKSGFDLEAVEHPAVGEATESLALALTIANDAGRPTGAWQGSYDLAVHLDVAPAKP